MKNTGKSQIWKNVLVASSTFVVGAGATVGLLTTSCSSTKLPEFEIKGIDSSLTYYSDYSEHKYNLSTTTILSDTTVIWNTTGSIESYLDIDLSTLTIKQGLAPGNYNFNIVATASKPNYQTRVVTKPISLKIQQYDISDFSIIIDGWTALPYQYDNLWFQLQTTNLYPSNANVDYSLSYSSTSNITISGSRLNIASGLNAGQYAFQIQATASKEFYNSKTEYLSTNLVINKGEIPNFQISGITDDESITYGDGATYDLYAENLMSGCSISWSLSGNQYPIDKITIGENTGTLTIDNTTDLGIYDFIIQCKASKSNYSDRLQQFEVSLTIDNGVKISGGDLIMSGQYGTASQETNQWNAIVHDEENQSVTYEIVMDQGEQPAWLNFNQVTKKVFWSTPNVDGIYYFKIKATSVVDQDYYGFSRLITLTINHGDVEVTLTGGDTIMSGYVGVSGIENNSWDATVSGSQNQSINWSLIPSDSGSLPTWLYFDSDTKKVMWNDQDDLDTGTYMFKVRATAIADMTKFSESTNIILTVTKVNIIVTGGDGAKYTEDFGFGTEDHKWCITITGIVDQRYTAEIVDITPGRPWIPTGNPWNIAYDMQAEKATWNIPEGTPIGGFVNFKINFKSLACPFVDFTTGFFTLYYRFYDAW